DLALDHRAGFDRGARYAAVRKVLAEHLVIAPEIARIREIHRDLDDIAQVRTVQLQNAAYALDGPARFFFDIAAAHVAVLVLGNLSGDVDEIARANRGVEWQIRIALA